RRGARRSEDPDELAEDEPSLCDDVAFSDERPVGVGRENPGEEDEISRAHRIGGVRQLGPSRHVDLFACPHFGIPDTASTSILAPGSASALTSTSVEAGLVDPKTSWRTGLTSGRSAMSTRKIVTLNT